jgi:hypothetical protein
MTLPQIIKRAVAVSGLSFMAACASSGSRQVAVPAPQAMLPEAPATDVLQRAMRDVCFAYLETGTTRALLARNAGFKVTDQAGTGFGVEEGDNVYSASFASSPVLLALATDDSRCTVIVVRGDFDELKLLGEEELAAFDARRAEETPEHLAFIENSPVNAFAMKFTLLSGNALSE